ncbi:MAG: catechol 1,2-dioxygenase [Pseudonocardia sp.]|nr:catechol 1,2-dioxygenase [Pseudonocardia sp.]
MSGHQRISVVVRDLMDAVNQTLDKHNVTYEEYRAAKDWLIRLGRAGEWPLYLDVFHEHAVERLAARNRQGSDSTIEGPYYLPDAPRVTSPAALPRRDDERGERLLFTATVRSCTGAALPRAEVDMWQADAEGTYSGFDSDARVPNLRGVVTADEHGRVEIHSIAPAPYEIPKDGPTGELIREAGWHAWRPAHLHFIVRADGHRPLTTQLYLPGDPHIDCDVANAVKPGLILEITRHRAGEHGIDVPHAATHYDFRLEPVRAPRPVH